MLNNTNKQPVKVAILEISAQNKAVLEYFFSESGKSYFKEVSADNASAFIIDYDSPGAKESWESTYKETQKPGIIISIKEVDLPSTLWVAKPLTVKALMKAGDSIKEMIHAEDATQPVIEAELSEEETAEVIETLSQKEQIVDELPEEMFEVTKTFDAEILEEIINDATEESTTEGSIDEKTNEETALVVAEESIEEDIQIDSLLDNELKNSPTELEPELAIAETSASASSSNFAVSPDMVDVDLSLEDSDEDAESESSMADFTAEKPTELKTPIDEPELSGTNNVKDESEIDSLLENLISGGENTGKVDNLLTDFTEESDTTDDKNEENLLDFDLNMDETETVEIQKNTADTVDLELGTPTEVIAESNSIIETENVTDDLETTLNALDSNEIIDETTIDKILDSGNKTEKPKKSAEEELQSLLEEIRQEADGTLPTSGASKSAKRNKKYVPTSAEERWKLTCGNNKDTTKLKSLCSFTPNKHLLASVIHNIALAKESNQFSRMKFNGIILVINPEADLIYCDQEVTSEFFAAVCYEPINKDKIKIHRLDTSEIRLYSKKMETEDDYTHSAEAFIWTTSLLTSRGRLPKNTNLKAQAKLKFWPNLTRLENIPNMMQVGALFHKPSGNLTDIISKSGLPQKYVIAFYNAALALDMIDNSGTISSSASPDTKNENNKKRGVFSRLLKRVTA